MYLKELSLINFKNYPEAQMVFSPEVNCFTGLNGEGKTNLLDAIHYLSFCKSFFNPVDSQNIRFDEPFFVIEGTYDLEGEEERIYCGQKRNQRKSFKRNKKDYERLADHIGLLPLVMISPADTELIHGGSEQRRKFMDSILSQYDKAYLEDLISYNKALAHRNALLKQMSASGSRDWESLEIWDEQLITPGVRIHERRKKFLERFIALFQESYFNLCSGREIPKLVYVSALLKDDFVSLLKKSRDKDLVLEYTSVGIHKDDIEFLIDDRPAKRYGSQGQQKSVLVGLRLAEYKLLKEIKKMAPILLLDDIYDKLDEERIRKLMELVSKHDFGQIFITDTNAERIRKVFEGINTEVKMFYIENNLVTSH